MPINISSTSQDVIVRIGAIDESAAGFDQAQKNIKRTGEEAETMRDRMNGAFNKVKTNWLAVAGAITTVAYALKKAWDLAEKAAQFDEMKAGLNALSSQYNMTADAAIRLAQVASGGQLSMQRAGEMAAKAFTLGLNPAQMKTFIEQAERLTDVVGGDIPTAFAAMEQAAATGRSRGLVQYGIVVDLTKALKDYADKHGIAKDSIDETTAMQIRMNAIMEAAAGKIAQMGPAMDSTADKMNRMRAAFEDTQLMVGQFIPRIAAGIAGVFYEIGAATSWAVGKMAEGLGNWIDTLDKITFGKIKFVGDAKKWTSELAASEASQAAIAQKKANDSFSVMVASTKELAAAQTVGKTAMDKYTGSTNEWKKTLQDLSKDIAVSGFADQFQKKIEEVHIKARELLDKYKNVSGARIEITRWEASEVARIQQESRDFDTDAVRKGMEQKRKESETMLAKFFADEETLKEKRIKEAHETSRELMRISNERLEAIRADEEYHFQVRAEQYKVFQNFMNQAGGGELGTNLGNLAATGKGEDQYTLEIERANQHYLDMVTLNQGYWDAVTLNAQAAAERDEQIKQATTQRTLSTTSSAFGAMAGMAKAYYAASGNENSKAYKLYKAFSKAQIVVDTAKAAIGAYQAMVGIPYIGPVLAVIAAAAAIMYGKAQMDAVDAAEPGGGSVSSSAGGGGGGTSYPSTTSTVFEDTTKKEESKTPLWQIHIYGDVVDHDKFARNMIESLDKARADKVT